VHPCGRTARELPHSRKPDHRQSFPDIKLVGVDTVGSAIFGQPARPRLMRGLGSSIYPRNVYYGAFSEVHWVNAAEAVTTCRRLAATSYHSALGQGRLIGTYYGLYTLLSGAGILLGNLASGAAPDLARSAGLPALPWLALLAAGAASAAAVRVLDHRGRLDAPRPDPESTVAG
jgi:hypothetical protein